MGKHDLYYGISDVPVSSGTQVDFIAVGKEFHMVDEYKLEGIV